MINFLKYLLLLVTLGISNVHQPFVSRHFNVTKLAPGVWACIQNDDFGHAICNAGIVDLGDKTVVFDPFMTPEAARDLKQKAEELTGRKVSLVVNSHYHNDHIRGNQVFAPFATIISTAWTRDTMNGSEKAEHLWEISNVAARAAESRKQWMSAKGSDKTELAMWTGYYEGIQRSLKELNTTLPDKVFKDSLWIHGTKKDIKLIECQDGHTHSDAAMLLPGDGIIFMGDLLFVNRHPYVGDGDAINLRKLLSNFQSYPAYNIYVPGHGPVGSKAEIQLLINYLTDLQQLVTKDIANNIPDSLIVKEPVPAAYQSWWYRRFYSSNLQSFCDKLRINRR